MQGKKDNDIYSKDEEWLNKRGTASRSDLRVCFRLFIFATLSCFHFLAY
jgi:hypothetical protein